MEEYKSNSFKSREEKSNVPAEKKVEKVVSGTAKTQKKNDLQKFADVFISEDVGNVKSYILLDVLVPAIKKAISDVITNGVDMILYGETGRSKKSGNSASKVSYRQYYNDQQDVDRRRYVSSSRNFDYDNLLFENRADAEAVLDAMNDIIGQYQVVSVADLFDLAGESCDNFNANKYGWYDIRGCKALRVKEGYVLRLPKALPLN